MEQHLVQVLHNQWVLIMKENMYISLLINWKERYIMSPYAMKMYNLQETLLLQLQLFKQKT
eukprot:7053016-Ditylum_brightwellii.AAC.1